MSAPLVLAVVLAVVIPVQLFRAHRLGDAFIERWARERGLALTAENRPMVVRYLRDVRVLRTWGGVLGATLPSLIELVWSGRVQVLGFGTDGENAPLGFGTIFVGYLLGAFYAEVSLVRPAAGTRRRASLVRRELTDYLPRRIVVAQRCAAGAGALGLLAAGLLPYADPGFRPGLPMLAIAAAVVAAFGAGLEAIERWMVRRPQPVTSAPVVAADDAIRAASIHAVAGAALALLLLFCCGVALLLQASDATALRASMAVVAAVCLLLSLVVCRDVGAEPWRVRGRGRAGGAAPA